MTKTRTCAAPPDDRRPDPLSAAELAAAKVVADSRERMKIHRILLTESLRRLRSGRQLEREHGVIHPEMTAITRDVLRLTDLVFPGKTDVASEADVPAHESDGARAIAELLSRATPERVAKVSGLDARAIVKWSRGAEVPGDAERKAMAARLKIPCEAWDRLTGGA